MMPRALGRLAALLPLVLLAPAAGASTVSGRVLDSGGNPVRGARVAWEAYRTDEETLVDETKGAVPAPLGDTATDGEGRFRVTLGKPGVEVAIRVLPAALPGALLPGPYDSSEDVDVDDIELPAAEKVSGRVTDEAGKPVSGAKVRLRSGSPFEDDAVRYAEATSGADGAFSIANAPGKSGSLTVRASGYAPFAQFSMRRSGVEKITLRSGGTVSGTVLDPAGKPAEGAIVLSGSVAAKSDASGTYRLAGVPRGTRTLEALGKGDLATRNDEVRVKTRETSEVSLRLSRSASVAGSVIDEKTRRPVAGVRVSASAGGFSFSFREGETASRRARTDAKGKFRIAGLAARGYSIKASKTDYLPATMPGIVAGVSAPGSVAIALQKAAGVIGRVTDEKGAPVPGARVRFVAEQGIRAILRGGPAALLGRSGVGTGPDGGFRLRGLAAEKNRTLEATRPGYVPARRAGVTLRAGEVVKDVSLVLKRGLEARGRVVDTAGQPIAGAEVRMSRPEKGGNRFLFQIGGMGDREKADASSGPDGSFRVAGLEAGEYALAVSREGYAQKQVSSVNVVADGPNDWPPVVLSPGVAIAGFVRNGKGEPVVGAQVSSFAVNAGPRGTTTSDTEGRFRLEGFDSGRAVMLSVRAEGYGFLNRQVSAPSDDLSLVLKTTGTIRGRVEDAATNRPVTDFSASYSSPRGGFGMQVRMGETEKAFQSADGTFELTDVPAGKWKLTASAPGYRPAEVSGIEIGEGETKEGVVFSLKKGASVAGRVLDPRRGTGIPNASVSWSEGSGASGMNPGAAAIARMTGDGTAVSTDADGLYHLDGLPAGKVNIAAEHPDYLEVSRQVEVADEATVDLTLSLGGSIAGTVIGNDRRSAVPGAQVTLAEQGESFGMGGDTARSDASGNFVFEHLKPGRYRMSARSNAGSTPWRDVVLAESQRLDGVLLEMEGGALVRGTVSGLPPGRLGGVSIYASGQDYEDTAKTGDDGRFTLRDVPAGIVALHASAAFPSMRSISKNLEVPEGATEVPVEIVFEGASRLSGRVTRGEKALSGVFVSAGPDPPNAAGGRSSGRTDEDGHYAIEGLADGNYQVLLSGSGVSYRRNFTVSGDTNGDIALPAVSISGVVTEAGSNDPIEGASVQVESGQETATFAIKRALTDSHGFYSLDDVDSGNYQLTARKESYQLKTEPISVGSSSVERNVSLSRGSGLSIRAVDGLTAIPLRSIYALAYSGTGAVAFSGSVSLDSEGKGEISSLATGIYALSLFSDGYGPRSFPGVQVPSPGLSVGLTPGGRVEIRTEASLTGRLVDGSGAAYRMSQWRLDGRVAAAPPVSAWEHIAPGSYQLLVSSPSGDRSYPFSVTEGQTTTVEVR